MNSPFEYLDSDEEQYIEGLMIARKEHPEMDLENRHVYAEALVNLWKGISTHVVFDRKTMLPIVENGRVKRW